MTNLLLALCVIAYAFSNQLAWQGEAWQLITYAFAHANVAHLALNMLALYSFGTALEKQIGRAELLFLFIIGSAWGAQLQALTTPGMQLLGASAGVFALVSCYARRNPKARVLLVIFPVSAPQAVAITIGLSVLCVIFGWLSGVAHIAHLGGIVIGYFYGALDNRRP